MFPEWFTKPESVFRMVLWLLSPVYVWLVKKLLKQFREWRATTSLRAAKISLASLRKALDNPPTLLESVAYQICFLPIPIALTMTFGVLYFAPYPPSGEYQIDPRTAQTIGSTLVFMLFFLNYILFATIAVYGVKLAYRLRHGEAQYAGNYRAEIQRQIDRLRKKYPQL